MAYPLRDDQHVEGAGGKRSNPLLIATLPVFGGIIPSFFGGFIGGWRLTETALPLIPSFHARSGRI